MDLDNQYGMKNQHLALLEMLDEFLLLCKNNSISFSLGFGSMLGAIRHKGFIPWDDDIDLLIDRDNYKKLQSAILESSFFVLQSSTPNTLWIPRIKRRTLVDIPVDNEPTIDLFLVDNMPDGRVQSITKKMLVLFVQGMIKKHVDFKKGTIFSKMASAISWLAGRFFPLSFKFWLLEKVSVVSNKKNTKFCSTYNVEYIYVGRRYNGGLLKDMIEVEFEERVVPISKYYDSYLKELYGDYMMPPEVSDRVPKHTKKSE